MPTSRTRLVWTFVVTSVAAFMVALDNLVVTTALPSIRTDLGASLEQLEWTVNAYTLTFGVLLLSAAVLADRFGRRRVFVAGLSIFTIASAVAAGAPTAGTLVAARGGAGRRRGDRPPAHADPAQRRRPGGPARGRPRRVGCDERARGRARPADRW